MIRDLALDRARHHSPILRPRIGSASIVGEACPILLVQQKANPLPQHRCAMFAQVVVEVAQFRHERHQLDPCRLRPVGQNAKRRVACRVVVARDIEALEGWRKHDGGKMGR